MINTTLVVLSWLIIGPGFPFSIVISILLAGVISALGCHHLGSKTFALISVMGLMLIDCILIVFVIHFQLWQPIQPPRLPTPAGWLFQALFGLDFRLAEMGAFAAICVAIYVEFGRSRLNLAQAFPTLAFSEPTLDLVQIVKRLANNAKIECPELRLVDSGAPSAFTVRSKGKYDIAVSIGLLESFDTAEVEACIAHEISHIKNRDFTLRSLVTIARIALFTRVLSYFVETAFYRTRELLADKTAAILMGGPGPLISALTKLEQAECVSANPTGAAICCFDRKRGWFQLLSKHPNLSNRIHLLKEMELTRKVGGARELRA